ncbi:MAG: hypothetical protein DI538_02900 [Azospira oryzae]|nr:MAG: hypothetical protein DI538_02900 [Azospira oryzae]
MKTLSYRVLYILFELSFFLFIVFAIGFTFIEGRDLINSDQIADYKIGAFDSNVILKHEEDISIGQSPLEKANVETHGWYLNFSSRNTNVKIFMFLLVVAQFIYVFFILFVLRRFVLSLKANSVFTMENVKRLRIVGLLILFVIPFQQVLKFIERLWLDDYLALELPAKLIRHFGYIRVIDSELWTWITSGLLILVIAEVFRQGIIMKEEQDLTI